MKAIALALAALVAPVWLGSVQAAAPTEGQDDVASAETGAISKEQIDELAAHFYQRGVEANAEGRLEAAIKWLEAAHELNPESKPIRTLLQTVRAKLATRVAPQKQIRFEPVPVTARIIPEVDFEDAELKEVVNYLAREMEVNIVFDGAALRQLATSEHATQEPAVQEPAAQEPTTEAGDSAEPPAPPAPPRRDLITIHLKNVPFGEVLKYVLRYKGLRYIVEEHAIVIVPIGWTPPDEMVTEFFRLATGDAGARRILEANGAR